MNIYLDSCSLQRPLDDQNQIRIAAETEVILGILSLWEKGGIKIIGSDILNFEANRIPNNERKNYILELLNKLSPFVDLDDSIENRAEQFEGFGIKAMDALHLASAESIFVDYFCTCDDKFLRKTKNISDIAVQVVSPLELIEKIKL